MAIPPLAISLIVGGATMGLQYLLSPRPKMKPEDKGKLDDIRITGSEYGASIPRGWGKYRVGGNLIFSNGVTHTLQNIPSGGGKGVPQAPATRTHVYTTSIAVLVARPNVSTGIEAFGRIWADADLLLNDSGVYLDTFEAENATLAGGAATQADVTASGGYYVKNLGSGGTATFNTSSIPDPPFPHINDPDEVAISYTRIEFFYKCSSALDAVLDTDSAPDETITFESTGGSWSTKTVHITGFVDSLVFKNAGAAAPDLDAITVEKYWFVRPTIDPNTFKVPTYTVTGNVNQNIIYPPDVNDPSAYYNAPVTADGTGKAVLTTPIATTRYYKGTTTQTQDSAIVSWLDSKYGTGEGDLRTPAHRGYAYVVFDNKQLKQARVENYTFEVWSGNNTVNDVLETLCADVGITSYDFTATAGLDFYGFLESTQNSRRSLVESLERYFQFRVAEIDGELRSVLDAVAPVDTIDVDLLRAHADGEETPNTDGETIVKDETLFPREVRVSILNPDLEYRNDTVSAAVFASNAKESIEIAFPIIDTANTARTVAEKLLLKQHTEDKAVEFWGMPELAQYSVGDTVTVTLDGLDVPVRIERKQMSLPLGKIKFQGVAVTPYLPAYIQDDFTNQTTIRLLQSVAYQFPRNSIVVPIISKPVTSAETGKLGVYLAPCGRGRGASENIAVYREYDTDNYVLQFVADAPARVGICENSDAMSGTETVGVEDTTTELDIWFFDDIDLESVTAPDLAAYPTLNLLRVGDEWLQFRTAAALTLEDNSPYRSKWRVTNLQRGLFGTDGEIAGHAADEYATHFTEAVRFFPLLSTDVGTTVTLKAVTNGQAQENGQVTSFTFNPISAYTVTNATTDRTFDANAVTIDELADVVATVIDDLNL